MEDIFEGMHAENDRRSQPRLIPGQYSSVEFSLTGVVHLYQFRIWNISPEGMGVLVKEGSEVLEHLKVGDVLNLKYYRQQQVDPPEYLKTEIRHITKDEQGKFKGHYLVGFSILEKPNATT